MKKILLLIFVCIFSFSSCEKKQTVEYIVIKYTMPFEDLFDNNKFTKLKIDEIKFLTYANDSIAIAQTSKYINDLKNYSTERLEKVLSGEEKSNNIWEMQAKARACQELINNQASIIKVTYKSEGGMGMY